ncbi:MAG: ECF transporter S component [Parasporobacterium sp.]|nr:ECF transporter S component [Parasporobacterium sp.]
MSKSGFSTKKLVLIGMLTAISFVAVLLGRLVPNIAGFLSYDPKDAVIAIAGFMTGPVASLIITVLVSVIEMFTISSTGWIGLLMNVLATCGFALPAVIIYRVKRTRARALIGLGVGIAVMTAAMVGWNYAITPLYMGVSREVVAGMLVPVFLPFNLAKGFVNAGISFLLYKPVAKAFRKSGLAEPSNAVNDKAAFNVGLKVLIGALIVTFAIVLIIMMK